MRPLVDEAIQLLAVHWGEMIQAGGPEWGQAVAESLTAATIAACKLSFMSCAGGLDRKKDQDGQGGLDSLNRESDAYASRHMQRIVQITTGQTAVPQAFAPLREKEGIPYWFISTPLRDWAAGWTNHKFGDVEKAAMGAIVALGNLREGRDRELCLAAHAMALVCVSKMFIFLFSTEQGIKLESIGNKIAHGLIESASLLGLSLPRIVV
jgi:hypothetical protein